MWRSGALTRIGSGVRKCTSEIQGLKFAIKQPTFNNKALLCRTSGFKYLD